jgi:hypothetical protein
MVATSEVAMISAGRILDQHVAGRLLFTAVYINVYKASDGCPRAI